MSSRQFLIDASTRHQVFLQRYAGGQAKIAVTALNRLRRQINARLSQEPTIFQRSRLKLLLDDINQLIAQSYLASNAVTKQGALELAESEAAFSVKLFDKVSTQDFVLPSNQALIASVEGLPMVPVNGTGSVRMDEALRTFGIKKAAGISQIITDGVTLGDTTQQIAHSVDKVIRTLHKRQLTSLVKTISNHASSVARSAVYEQNENIIDGYEWVATLDGKTTLICGTRDGQFFQSPAGPLPPAHWNCRSTTIPKIKREFQVPVNSTGKRPSVGSDGAKEVGAGTTYGGWLKTQPVEFVDEALGVERSALFRSGKLTLDKFVDPTGRVYTLTQLEGMNPFVFQEF